MKDTTKDVLEKIEEIVKYQDEIIKTCKKIIKSLESTLLMQIDNQYLKEVKSTLGFMVERLLASMPSTVTVIKELL